MSKSWLWLIVLLLWLILGCFICWKFICGGGVSAAAPAAAAAAAVAPAVIKDKCTSPWQIKDGNKFSASSNEHLKFAKSSSDILRPSNNANTVINKTVDYLKKNKDRMLTITGYYDKDERNNSIVENLGKARANKVASLLKSKGIEANRLVTVGERLKINCFKRDSLRKDANGVNSIVKGVKLSRNGGVEVLQRGAGFSFAKFAEDKDRIGAIRSRLVGKPLTLYFATNSDQVNLTGQQRTDISDMMYYLDNVAGSKLDISGHTDNVGNLQSNINLSKERAEFARDYLTSRGGIQANRMTAQGYGPNRPVGPNTTSEGRSKNRRVEVTLK